MKGKFWDVSSLEEAHETGGYHFREGGSSSLSSTIGSIFMCPNVFEVSPCPLVYFQGKEVYSTSLVVLFGKFRFPWTVDPVSAVTYWTCLTTDARYFPRIWHLRSLVKCFWLGQLQVGYGRLLSTTDSCLQWDGEVQVTVLVETFFTSLVRTETDPKGFSINF